MLRDNVPEVALFRLFGNQTGPPDLTWPQGFWWPALEQFLHNHTTVRANGQIVDQFGSYDSLWSYADHELFTGEGCKVYYLKAQAEVGQPLSMGEGSGLRMVMSGSPCSAGGCKGAEMASAHLSTSSNNLYGTYELRMRPPHEPNTSSCPNGVYGYFTAGYARSDGKWNEMNLNETI